VTSRYGRPLAFGVSIVPASADLKLSRALARRADELGLDLIGIQDHPYQWRFLDTWSLIGDLLARTERIRLFPDVANLPLRGPAMIAKQAASLDVLSGGRFELGLGSGAFWEAIEAMGGPVRSGSEIRRIFNVDGKIADKATNGPLNGPPEQWIETLRSFALELGFDTFVFWPEEEPLVQVQRFADEVIPAVRG
jgi:hypothetical protein